MRLPLDPTVLLHAVDLPHQGHRLDFKQIGKARLVDPLVAGEVAQHLALRPGETEKEQSPLIETPAEQAGDVMNEKPQAAVEGHSDRNLEGSKGMIPHSAAGYASRIRAAGSREFDGLLHYPACSAGRGLRTRSNSGINRSTI